MISRWACRPTNGVLTPSIRADVESVLNEKLANVSDVRDLILGREMTLF